jgi:hypothetical protein
VCHEQHELKSVDQVECLFVCMSIGRFERQEGQDKDETVSAQVRCGKVQR